MTSSFGDRSRTLCGACASRTKRSLPWIRHHALLVGFFAVLSCLLTLQLGINLFAARAYRLERVLQSLYANSTPRSYFTDRLADGPARRRPAEATDGGRLIDFGLREKINLRALFALFGGRSSVLPSCPHPPQGLVGQLSVSYQSLPWRQLESRHPEVEPGGRWRPHNCTARYRVAIIVPYRDRSDHLRIFLNHIHPYLQRQLLAYAVYVIEQDPYSPFNRGLLLNIGYREAVNDADYDCVIFHDVDLLPENDRNLYSCPDQPRHMSVAVDEFAYRLPYESLFGGVEAFRKDHFELINGFSNMYFGWGAEDDDLYQRLQHHGLNLTRYPKNIARYSMVRHLKSDPNPIRFKFLQDSKERSDKDGLNSLMYDRKRFEKRKLFTWIYARVNQTAIMQQFDEVMKAHTLSGPAHLGST